MGRKEGASKTVVRCCGYDVRGKKLFQGPLKGQDVLVLVHNRTTAGAVLTGGKTTLFDQSEKACVSAAASRAAKHHHTIGGEVVPHQMVHPKL